MSVNQQDTKLDAGRFGDLHKAYYDRLLSSMTSVVRDRQAAEEITASAFAKALQYLATFRGEASFYTWLHAIASNEAPALLERKPRHLIRIHHRSSARSARRV